jgi:hypothetical protein
MNLLNPSESKLGAYIFMLLACLMFLSSFAVINSPAPALIISFFLLSIIVMLMGLQRLSSTQMHTLKFAKIIKTLSTLTVITSCTAIIINTSLG